jgi:hypothetical protein
MIEITEEKLDQIERCASLGLTLDDIALIISVSRKTLVRRLADNEEARDAYDRGRAKAKLKVLTKLFELIENGDNASIFFYLKCQCRWSETQQQQIQTSEVKIYLPEKNDI